MSKAKKLPSGSWRIRVYDGSENGKAKYISFTAETKKAVEIMAAEHSLRKIKSKSIDPDDITFYQAAQRYINSKDAVLSPNTITGYYVILRNYLYIIKDKGIHSITNEDIQMQINALARDHSPKTVKNASGFISSVMKMYNKGFSMSVKTPAKEKVEVHIPNDDDIKKLLAAAEGTDVELAIMLAAFGSLRRSEICALMLDCVQEDHIQIKRTFARTHDNKFIIKNHPKSYAGYRDVYLPQEIMDKLKDALMGHPKEPLFTSPASLSGKYRRIVKKAGIEHITFHALRHYFATFLHASGVPDQYIAKIGGWEDVSTLQKIYQHTTKETLSKANLEILNKFSKINE